MFHSLRVMGVTSEAERGVLGPFFAEAGLQVGGVGCLRGRTGRMGDFREYSGLGRGGRTMPSWLYSFL
jgi:hypothetical protein